MAPTPSAAASTTRPLAAADPEAVTIPELDLWGYAGANPVRNVDPAGTCISDSCFDRQAK